MSDPVTNVEIEDVLSSIRRLVSEGDRPNPPKAKPAEVERLVLTPSLRVSDPDEDAADEAPAPMMLTNPDLSAPVEPDPEPEVAEPEEAALEAADAEVDADEDAELETSGLLGQLVQEEIAKALDMTEAEEAADEALAEEPAADAPEAFEPAEAAPMVEDVPDDPAADIAHWPETRIAEPHTDDPDEVEAMQHSPVVDDMAEETEPEPAELPDVTIVDAVSELADAPEAVDVQPEIEDASTDEPSSLESKISELEQMVGAQDDEWEPEIADEASQAAFFHRRPEPMDWEDHTPAATEDVLEEDDLAPVAQAEADTAPALTPQIDEDMLRDIVAEMVRSELKGVLGERITRNVRKLVRREVHRVLMSQDYE
ncbi:MAG: hypothetical protein QNJ09_02955 [Paracoccaceae bacterium]|nr:hypothetical protein [Paracoccaceae bacterium]